MPLSLILFFGSVYALGRRWRSPCGPSMLRGLRRRPRHAQHWSDACRVDKSLCYVDVVRLILSRVVREKVVPSEAGTSKSCVNLRAPCGSRGVGSLTTGAFQACRCYSCLGQGQFGAARGLQASMCPGSAWTTQPQTLEQQSVKTPDDFDRETFGEFIVEAHRVNAIELLEAVCFHEPHALRSLRLNLLLRADGLFRWLSVTQCPSSCCRRRRCMRASGRPFHQRVAGRWVVHQQLVAERGP